MERISQSICFKRIQTQLIAGCSALALIGCTSLPEQSRGSRARVQNAIAKTDSEIARFLEQATFGPTPEEIQHVRDDLGGGLEAWIEEQFQAPASNYPAVCCDRSVSGITCTQLIPCNPGDIYAYPQNPPAGCGANSACRRDNYSQWKLQQIFYLNALTAPDQLRQRMFFALNQILVTSGADDDINLANRMSPYLRMLENNAFGNFKGLLYQLSTNATMGRYLDNITNSVDELNENYAREIMQLFSIGLVQLAEDGTTDGTPTYDQAGVVELTRTLTGWVPSPQIGPMTPNYIDPLIPDESRHDTDEKVVLGTVIPAGQTAEQDLRQAIDILFSHPNMGPFIGKALIQMFVTSNPSPDYVRRVARKFNADDNGARGNLQAVIKQVLLDPEARSLEPAPDFGKLREPVLAVTNLLRNFNTWYSQNPSLPPAPVSDLALVNPTGTPTTYLAQGQDVFRSPTVFNFFSPDFPVPGKSDLVGPEFSILSTTTALSRRNLFYQLINNSLASQNIWRPSPIRLDLSAFEADAADPAVLTEDMNQILLHGEMSLMTRQAVIKAISDESLTPDEKVREAAYLVSTSSAYQVQR